VGTSDTGRGVVALLPQASGLTFSKSMTDGALPTDESGGATGADVYCATGLEIVIEGFSELCDRMLSIEPASEDDIVIFQFAPWEVDSIVHINSSVVRREWGRFRSWGCFS